MDTKVCKKCAEVRPTDFYYGRSLVCKTCHNERMRLYMRAHPEQRRKSAVKWRANPENRAKEIAAARRWQENNPERFKQNKLRFELKKHYGITVEQFNEM